MYIVPSLSDSGASLVGFGIRTLLLAGQEQAAPLARRLAGLGSQVEAIDEMFTALSEVIEDPVSHGLLVVDCDSTNVGGIAGGRRLVQMMGDLVTRVPVILISSECRQQHFPEDRMAATELRAPLSSVSLRVGFEHALRERLAYRAA